MGPLEAAIRNLWTIEVSTDPAMQALDAELTATGEMELDARLVWDYAVAQFRATRGALLLLAQAIDGLER